MSAPASARLEVSGSVAANPELDQVLQDCVRRFRQELQFELLVLVLHDPAHDVMRFNLIDSATSLVVRLSLEWPVTSSPVGMVWQTQQSLVLKNLGNENRWPAVLDLFRRNGLGSYYVVL